MDGPDFSQSPGRNIVLGKSPRDESGGESDGNKVGDVERTTTRRASKFKQGGGEKREERGFHVNRFDKARTRRPGGKLREFLPCRWGTFAQDQPSGGPRKKSPRKKIRCASAVICFLLRYAGETAASISLIGTGHDKAVLLSAEAEEKLRQRNSRGGLRPPPGAEAQECSAGRRP